MCHYIDILHSSPFKARPFDYIKQFSLKTVLLYKREECKKYSTCSDSEIALSANSIKLSEV
jgi:hypothetical protein